VLVANLSTHYGVVSYAMRAEGPDRVSVELAGGLAVPPGGVEIRSPRARPMRAARVNGAPAAERDAARVVVREVPATVVLDYAPGSAP
jgi:hypothetical protein